MKTRISIYFALIVSAFMLTACPETDIDKLLEIDGPIAFEETYTFDLKEGDSLKSYRAEKFSTTYKGIKINEVKINSITGTFSNIENPYREDITFIMTITGTQENVAVYNIELTDANNNQTIDLKENAEHEIKKFESYLVANPEAQIESYFEASGAPISFDFKLEMNLTVTGTPE